MPAVPPNGTILVTGVTGYIAAHVASQLLEAGFRVVGTARSPKKADYLKSRFSSFGDKFQVAEVKDIVEKGVFDDLVKDVDGIAHVASPVHWTGTTPDEYLKPAIEGTMNILEAAHAHGTRVQHVCVTSSLGAYVHPAPAGYTYTDADWNEHAGEVMKDWQPGQPLDIRNAYRASKSAAERAAWTFAATHKPRFGLSTVAPGWTFGPVLHLVSTPADINTSAARVWTCYSGAMTEFPPAAPAQSFVDVRDVAEIHVRALTTGNADGRRLIASDRDYSMNDVTDILRRRFPENAHVILKHDPDLPPPVCHFDNSLARELLGVEFKHSLEEMVVDTVNSLKEFGF